MKKKIYKVISHPLISGGAVIIIGSSIGNVFNYLFNLSMGRLLTVVEYGILASLISLFNIFIVFSVSITTVFSKFSASFIAKNKNDHIGILFKKGTMFIGLIGLIITLLIIIMSASIANFLKIKDILLIDLIAISLFFSFLSSVASGILQGLFRFFNYSMVYVLGALSKVILAIIFVFLSFHVFGPVWAILLSTGIAYLAAIYSLKNFLYKDKIKGLVLPNLHGELVSYGLPVLLSSIGLTLIYTMDVILVKHFFSGVAAGQYAALSLMGRSIFFIVAPLSSVFFTLIAQKKERNENLSGTVFMSVALTAAPAIILSGVYFLFPGLILHVFFPAKEYLVLVPYLGPFSIFILFYTLSNLLNSYYLSIGQTSVYFLTLIAAILEILYIVLFHNSLTQVVNGMVLLSFLLLIALLMYGFFPNFYAKIRK